MPPRKSDVSKVGEGDEGTPAKEASVKDGINIEDLNLPKSIVTRLAKGVLPANTQIQGNAMIAMSKSATVFVNYLASTANENAASSGRKTISPQDVLKALDELEFGDFKPRLEAELAKFNETQTDKRNAYRKKVATTAAEKPKGRSADGEGEEEEEGDEEPKAKKARRDGGGEDLSHDQEQEDGEEEEGQEETDEESDEVEDDADARLEEQMDDEEEQAQRREAEDEAMDNGDDSD